MQVIFPFDPWKSKLCTCPQKYSFSPYTGCGHGCLYCYASSYIPNFFQPRLKKNVIKRFESDLKRIDITKPISIANSSDPYQPLEEKYRIMRSILAIAKNFGARIQIVTKSDLVTRDVDLLGDMKASVSITITTLDEQISKRLEPHAPEPRERINAIKKLTRNGIKVSVRIDPIIPSINDDMKMLEELVKKVANAGALHIVSSTYKARPDNWKRLVAAFPEIKRFKNLWFKGEKVSNSFYLPKEIRYSLLLKLKEIVVANGVTFATCREGFPELQTSKTCDGTHLIGVRNDR